MKFHATCFAAMLAAALAGGVSPCRGDIVFAPAPGEDCADALQALIDASPNDTISIPDGIYLLSHPVSTPAKPELAVSLALSNFAVLRAAPDFPERQPLVRLGGVHPANDIRTPGSVYGLCGGVLDGSGRAAGVCIESGRETRVQNVSMKNVWYGLKILRGANNGSSDCDIRDVNITGNRRPGSVGVILHAYDNTLTNMRIADCQIGVRVRAGGNLLTNVHPLWTNPSDQYDAGIGFDVGASDTSFVRCYSDHFSTGWRFRKGSDRCVLDGCVNFWYASSPGRRHTAIRCDGTFEAMVTGMWFGFKDGKAVNTALQCEAPGGRGFIADPRLYESNLNDPADAFRDYLRGTIHGVGYPPAGPVLRVPRIDSASARFGAPPALPAPVCPEPEAEAASWVFVSVTNGVCDDVCAAPCGDDDLSYRFRCLHDDGGLLVETIVRDDDVSTDTCPAGAIDCRSWLDDCIEVFLDGEMARLPDSRADGGRHLWHGGEFVLVANGAAQSNSSAAPNGYVPPARAFGGDLPDVNWWTGEAFPLPGFGYAGRIYIPWRSMGHDTAPARVGFTISVQDDDGGGERDHTLYWQGNPAKPHLDERAFGVLEMTK